MAVLAGGRLLGPSALRAALVRPGTSSGHGAELLWRVARRRNAGGGHPPGIATVSTAVSFELDVGGAEPESNPGDAGTLCISDHAGGTARDHAELLERLRQWH